ncbi:MAG: uroporphyrinogen-III C-methyltransferase [Candidatus Nanopelagicales bacterium]|nr:uroporphyrinogen-III C-methyltransferase [Candidatus Nanopelagicales bacterium]
MRVAHVSSYPISLNLAGKRVVVVGAGTVAARRITSLIEAGAHIVVISPVINQRIEELAQVHQVELHRRAFETGDLVGAWLVHATTNLADVNELVAAEADAQGTWCIRADQALLSQAWTPASTRVDDVTVAVTANADPRRAAAIRDAIADQLTVGALPIRRVRATQGHVVLIGGGPGDPELITVRGRRELAKADVVVFDRLGPTSLLETLAPDVELIEAGKRPGHHTLNQDEINAVIVDRALLGKRVVRLKGGDPFVFGRGSEEVQACIDAGVSVDVVPGISSAVAGPASAGIPVTHRGLANGYAVITGHQLNDLTALAQVDLTLVVLMGVATLPALATGLIAGGKSSSTPVALIEKASTPQQRVTVGTLESIAAIASDVGVTNPAVIVIGDVVTVPHLLAAEPSFTNSIQ